jgi:hypothetical protein
MGRAYVAGVRAEPGSNGNLWLTREENANAGATSVTFIMPNVPAGSHTVKIQWRVWFAGDSGATDDRSLVVMAFPY